MKRDCPVGEEILETLRTDGHQASMKGSGE